MTNKDLKNWYLWYNKKFFNSELPIDCVVKWHKLDKKTDGAQLLHYVDNGKPLIYINPIFRKFGADTYALLLLLHEQIHLLLKVRGFPKRVYCGHGPEFRKQ